jgi:hypothetical protein
VVNPHIIRGMLAQSQVKARIRSLPFCDMVKAKILIKLIQRAL